MSEKAYVEYARRDSATTCLATLGKTIEQRSGNWLAASLSGKSPGKTLYLGKFLNPSFVSGSYTAFLESGAWDDIDIIHWKTNQKNHRHGYPNLHFPSITTGEIECLGDKRYDNICIEDLYTYLSEAERFALAPKLFAKLAPGGKIHIANRHIMRDGNAEIPAEWLRHGDYFQDSCQQISPRDVLLTFAIDPHHLASEQIQFDPAQQLTERLINTDNPELRTLFSTLYFITITTA